MRWILLAIAAAGLAGCGKQADESPAPKTSAKTSKKTPAAAPAKQENNQGGWTFRTVDPAQYKVKSVVLDQPTTDKDPAGNGWGKYLDAEGNGRMIYLKGGERGQYLRLFSKDVGKMGFFILGDFPYEETRNPNDTALGYAGFDVLTFFVKNNSPSHSPFQVWVVCEINGKGRQLQFQTKNGKAVASSGARNYCLGTALNDGAWHEVTLDLTGFVAKLNPKEKVTAVNGLRFVAEDLYLDEIKLSMLEPLSGATASAPTTAAPAGATPAAAAPAAATPAP